MLLAVIICLFYNLFYGSLRRTESAFDIQELFIADRDMSSSFPRIHVLVRLFSLEGLEEFFFISSYHSWAKNALFNIEFK